MISIKKLSCVGIVASLCCCIISCKTDPIIPAGGIPVLPPIQDPGIENLCEVDVISFQHEVLPILVSSCAYSGCHDVATAEDDIILDSYVNVIKEVRPGKPNNSELYEYIVETDPDDIMPPPPAAPLTTDQITLIRDWILQGALDTDCGVACDSTQTSFAANIFPLLQDYCIGCHNSNRMDGMVNLESYSKNRTLCRRWITARHYP